MSSAAHNLNVQDASREDSKPAATIGLGNDGQGGEYFKGLQKKRSMSQEKAEAFKDQTRQDPIGSVFAKITGIGGSAVSDK